MALRVSPRRASRRSRSDGHPDILDYVRNLPPGTPERLVTESKLRHMVKLNGADQLRAMEKHMPGLAAHQGRRSVAGNSPNVRRR